MSAESASRRNEYGEERYEHLYFQKAVREVYRKFEGPSWVNVKANEKVEEISNEITNIVLETLKRARNTPLESLWTVP
jgi:dTMP kinase